MKTSIFINLLSVLILVGYHLPAQTAIVNATMASDNSVWLKESGSYTESTLLMTDSSHWTKLPALPSTFNARANAIAFSIGNKAYVGGGQTEKIRNSKDFWEFNSTTGVWTELPALPADFEIKRVAFALSIGDKAYVGGLKDFLGIQFHYR